MIGYGGPTSIEKEGRQSVFRSNASGRIGIEGIYQTLSERSHRRGGQKILVC